MGNKNTVSSENCDSILLHTSQLINCSFEEIKNKYADYPHCVMNYFEKNLTDKSIEIRFDKEEVTITCTFNSDEISDYIILFPDKEEIIHGFIGHLSKTYDYDYIKLWWIAPDYFIMTKELTHAVCDVGFVFISKI